VTSGGVPFGRYRLIDLLGHGGMGQVWRAWDPVMGRFVALKVLPESYTDNANSQERFRREARAAAGLDERHVIPIYDSGEIDGRLFVTMKLIKGADLQQLVEDGPLPPERAVSIIEQVAWALDAAHRVKLVHRDVKPSNIFVEHDDFTYLIDFGIARAAGEGGLTSTGSTIGTWAYMAPERFRNGVADASSDIYALACVLYQALTGQPPFPAEALEQIAVAHMLQPPPKPSELQPAVPEAMDDVIARGMAKEPDQRYASTVELARAARAALAHKLDPPLTSEEATAATGSAPTDPAPTVPDPAPTVADTSTEPQVTAESTNQQNIPPPNTERTLPEQHSPPPPAQLPTMQAPTDIEGRSIAPAPPTHDGPSADSRPPVKRTSTRTKILAALAVVVVAVIAIVAIRTNHHQQPQSQQHPSQQPSAAPSQTVLPFTDLKSPNGVAVDNTGAVYVVDSGNNRVVELAAGASTQTVLPFAGLNNPWDVAADGTNAIYVTDEANGRVLELASGTSTATVLPFTDVFEPRGVAIDRAGAVYVAASITAGKLYPIVKLAAGATRQALLPSGVSNPFGVAVDSTGATYVIGFGDGVRTDDDDGVRKWAAGATAPTWLPFAGLGRPGGVAVDGTGAVYVTDSSNNRVLKLAAGSATPTVLPFTDLRGPGRIAVDAAGAVYVVDLNNRVVKLQQ